MKQFALALALLAFYGNACAQNLKFGKPTNEELSMTVYDKDPEANAVVLCHLTNVSYCIDFFNYLVDYQVKKRIKILKDEGKDYANVSFPYIFNEKEQNCQEYIEDFSAVAYNLEGGKVVRTKIGKDKLFKERVNDDYMLAKFAVPQVKAGTVIEYEYKIHSNVFYHIYDWFAQEEIPVAFAKYKLEIPTIFMYNVEINGLQPLQNEVTIGALKFKATTNNLSEQGTCKTNIYNCLGRDIPALKKDEFIWNIRDYTTKVTAELKGIYSPDKIYHEVRKEWDQIDEQLLSDAEFGGQLNNHSKFHDELLAKGINDIPDLKEKIVATFQMLREKLAWNGKYELWPHSASETIKKGNGSNADLNMILINMLGDVGVKATPVLMSTRSNGSLPQTYPSLQKINTFIVGIPNGSSWLYVDASSVDGYLNTLPANLYTDRARIIQKGEKGQWKNLQKIGDAKNIIDVSASLTPDGKIIGTETAILSGNEAANERKSFRNAKDSIDFISQKAQERGIEIIQCEITGHKDFSPSIKEIIHFTKQGDVSANHIYINPFPEVPISKNPFLETERLLPVEFPFAQLFTMNMRLSIPKGWEVDELPNNIRVSSPDNSITGHIFYEALDGNILTIQYNIRLKDIVYPNDKYATLKQLFDLFASRSKDVLVFKKKGA